MNAHETNQEASPPTAPAPVLVIDWGANPEADSDLTPEFNLVCPGLSSRPYVIAQLDGRLEGQYWQTIPSLRRENPAHWIFDEQLRLTVDARISGRRQYLLKIRAIFYEPGGGPARCFLAVVRISVPDPRQSDARTLEIRGDGGALVNLQGSNLRDFAKIIIQGEGDAVINVQEGLQESPPRETSSVEDRPCILKLPFKPDEEFCRCLPWRPADTAARAIAPGQRIDSASLKLADGRRILLLARGKALLGRERVDEHGGRVCDIVLRMHPLDCDSRRELSRLISRRHCCLELQENGLVLEDFPSGCGTYCDGVKTGQKVLFKKDDSVHRHTVVTGGVLGLDVALHRDPTWREDARAADVGSCFDAMIQSCLTKAAGGAMPPNTWSSACRDRIDAVRIRRLRRLPIADFYSALGSVLSPGQLAGVRRVADCIDLVDTLADREEYVLLFRTATIGSAPGAAVQLRGSGVADVHARVLHLGGGFWLEPLWEETTICANTGEEQRDTRTYVDGRQVARHELVPLVPGMKLRFGQTELTFDEFGQMEL